MPEKKTLENAQKDKREGKSPSTQAGEFVKEEMEHIREGKHGARSTKQAIAIGLSKACAPWPALSSAGEEQCLRASQCSSHSMLARAGEHFGHAAAVQRRAEDKMQRAKSGPAAMFEPSVAASEHNKGPKP